MRAALIACAMAGFVPFTAEAGTGDLVISELLAVNDSTVEDEDGDFSDYVEIYNAGTTVANLDGWYLTDDPFDFAKWRFPAVTVPPNGFVLVFASDKDRRDACCELHANFQLSSEGEFLALVAPDGVSIVWDYTPYPPQVGDFSFGLEQNGSIVPLVQPGAAARTRIPSNGSDGLAWTGVRFSDAGWIAGTTGVGYDRNPTYLPHIGTNVAAQMDNVNTSAYVRVPFTVPAGANVGGFFLRMQYDDGFVAYINGTRVASRNAPAAVSWNSSATAIHDDSAAVQFQEIPLNEGIPLVEAGDNVLAIHGLNGSLGSSDFIIQPELEGVNAGDLERETRHYFAQPTPGYGNLQGFPGVAAKPTISPVGALVNGSLDVTLSVDSPGTVVRYTTNGAEPTESSPVYSGPFRITTSTMVRAKGFEPGLAPSATASEGFIALAPDVRNVSSDLPIVLVDNFGGGSVPSVGFQPCFVALFETEGGRSRLSRQPHLEARAGIRIRGSSTLNRPKKAYAVEFWDEKNEDIDLSPFGLPAESDWILYGAYNFDRALVRNAFVYELSNQMGRYAVRTLFCEVYVNTGGGSLQQSDYVGVYSFMEKIKRGRDRVDVEKLTASVRSEPEISGGYMTKVDRLDPGDSGFNAGGQNMAWVYPKEENVSSLQVVWLQGYFNAFRSALNSGNFRDPVLGYRPYIDTDSWVDHHMINEMTKNPDGLVLSTYLFKSRGGPIEYGPVWDFDRTLGPDDDNRAADPIGFTNRFSFSWWDRLFDDPDFFQRYKDRWGDFRRGPMSVANMHSIIDSMADEIRESQARNFQRWPLSLGGGWQGEVDHLKSWITSRVNWIDTQFLRPPVFSSPGRRITPGFELTMTGSGGTLYYAADGSDPRLPGGAISPRAIAYSGPLELNDNTRVIARIRQSAAEWSPTTDATFVVTTPPLVITELMYHPLDPPAGSPYDADDFEFVEVLNTGSEPLDLRGARLTEGIRFEFGAAGGDTILAPDEYILVVKNLEAFEVRYGREGLRVAGEYRGNLNNAGDVVGLEGPLREPILLFEYSETWHATTDGDGDSLTIVDPEGPLSEWGRADSWTASTVLGGTPGAGDDGLPGLGGRQLPGDSNQDGVLDVSDAFHLMRRLFSAEPPPLPCDGASLEEGGNRLLLDLTGDLRVNLGDALSLLNYLFHAGPAPASGERCQRLDGCPSICLF